MRLSYRILVAIAVVCTLAVALRAPYVFASTPTPVPAMGTTDREALAALYHATDGDNWINNYNWLSDAPLDSWFGVTTDGDGRVIEIDLRENGLNGTIPPELGDLAELKTLIFLNNELSGLMPPELGSLTKLEWLYLWGNRLRGSIPPELANLASLKALDFSSNLLNGAIPPGLGNLNNLELLSLWDNQLSGTIPPELGTLGVLEELYLGTNKLTGEIPSELGNLASLKELDFSSNLLNGAIPPGLGNLNNLELLSLWDNQLSGTIPPELGTLGVLEELYLGTNKLTGEIPSELGNLASLKELDFSSNLLNGEIPPGLGDLTNLEILSLWDNQLGGSIPPELGNLTNLESLILSENQLSGTIPPELSNLTSLTKLYLSGNELRGAIPSGLGDLNNLEFLSLWNNQLSGTIPPELGNLNKLEQLYLSENQLSETIPSELGNLNKLEQLYLSENQLSGTIPLELGNLTTLTELVLSGNELRGEIPLELGNLDKLVGLLLSDNRLSGCVPGLWRAVEVNDLEELALPFCSDRDVLAAFYRAVDGANWARSDNWLTDAPVGTWYGVTTNRRGRVINLDLGENRLRGTIPSTLGFLGGLKFLDLSENELSGPIPPALGNIATLEKLDLAHNELSGVIPLELGGLINLESLSLWDNRLRGEIPAALGDLTNLTMLDLADNRLTGTVPLQLGKLTNLDELYLSGNRLRGCLPAVWRDVGENDREQLGLSFCITASSTHSAAVDRDVLVTLYHATDGDNWLKNDNWLTGAPLDKWHGVAIDEDGRVTELDLTQNELSGKIPPELANLSNLKELYFDQNQLSGEIPPELGSLTKLIVLYLNDNLLTGEIPSELGNLTNLLGLYLSSNQLGGAIPPTLGNLAILWRLDLSQNKLNGTIPPELGKLSDLVQLSLWNNELSGTVPPVLGNLANLEKLFLNVNRLSGPIPPELGKLTSLEQLYIRENQLTGCLPEPWKEVEENDFDELDLPFCTLSPSAAPQIVTSAQIFDKISSAVAFIQTETGSGSGVLVEGGYVLTNAHVVWPYGAARIVFPDGTAFDHVPLKGWDLMADLALLGPIDVPAQPLALVDGENISIGSDVYLIGYPAEVESYPQPTLARGILSRLREWEPVGITYLQTDAAIAGGQSGGALVSDKGEVIGISGLILSEGQFALVASAADLLPRIRELMAGEDPSGLGERRLPLEGGTLSHQLTSLNLGDAYILNQPAGSAIEVELSGDDGAGFLIYDSFGFELTASETASFSSVTLSHGPHFLLVIQTQEGSTLTANHPLTWFDDPDGGRMIQVGQSLSGNIDFPADFDYFLLHLEQGEAVEVLVRSALADPILAILRLDTPGEEPIEDDDSGGGLLGLDARLLFQAPYTGEYALLVVDALGFAPGGYIISVAEGQSTEVPAPPVPMATIKTHMNVREGPGTNYPVIGTAAPGEQYHITGKNPGRGDWWQIDFEGRSAWIYGPLVTATDAESVQVVATPAP